MSNQDDVRAICKDCGEDLGSNMYDGKWKPGIGACNACVITRKQNVGKALTEARAAKATKGGTGEQTFKVQRGRRSDRITRAMNAYARTMKRLPTDTLGHLVCVFTNQIMTEGM